MGAQCRVFSVLKWSFSIHLLSTGGNPQMTCRNAKPVANKSLCPEGLIYPLSAFQLPADGMDLSSCPTWMLEPWWVLSRLLGQHSPPQKLNLRHCCSSFSSVGCISLGYQGIEIIKIFLLLHSQTASVFFTIFILFPHKPV